ncbi:MAG TPA: malate synthase A, partial [Solirubrobacteraceae bacterium]|nr:malate synthase A [Solirubrobacteraceae bacterium]
MNTDDVLTPDAIEFLALLGREFAGEREELLAARHARARRLRDGELPDFLPQTAAVRDGDWSVPPAPADLADRRVEITGPTDRKMVINALNSGARVFMSDFEDSNSPTWQNMIDGQRNLSDAIARTITLQTPEKSYALNDEVATLLVRPRGWHLLERHFEVDGQPISASLFDFGLYLLRNHAQLRAAGSGPYFYLPKLESHLEARLWNRVFERAQDELGIARGTIRATVLIETILAAFEMDEILHELGPHATGLNAGRWDYLFSMIKKFRTRGREFVLPERNAVTMTAPFMRSYTELLVKTCHRRGAHAMGGMAAFIPNRRDPEVNEVALAKVRDDKLRESGDGFDGSWVAHPDLVPICMEVFDAVLGSNPNQISRTREDVQVSAQDLLAVSKTPGVTTEAGLRNDISVGIQYLATWLGGNGAVAIFNLMEDAATAEISRSQVWQWIHNDIALDDGQVVTRELVERLIDEELTKIRA